MIVFLAYYLIFYAAAFCALAFWKSWRLFVPASLVVGGLCVWATRDLNNADGPGAMFAFAFVGLFAFGALAGFLARLIVLLTRNRRYEPPERAVLIGVFLATPLAVWGWTQWLDYQRDMRLRPPSKECMSRLHAVSVGDVHLALPLAPVFSLSEQWDWQDGYFLSSPKGARKLCARTAEQNPVPMARVSIATGPSGWGHAMRVREFCTTPQGYPWWEHACLTEIPKRIQDYPDKVTLSYVDAYFSDENRLYNQVKAAGVTDLAELRTNMRKDSIGCYETKGYRDDVIHCTAQRMLTNSVQMKYSFRSNEEDREDHSKLMETRALEIVESLRRPQ